MTSRILAAGAALWALAYVGGYLAVINEQGEESPVWWYVGLVLLGAAAMSARAAGVGNKSASIAGLVLLGCAALLGLLSIGIFLLPAVVAAGIATAGHGRSRAPA